MFRQKIIKAFTIIEIMIGILIVSIILIGGFQALSSVTIGKSKLIGQTDIQKESLYFTQKLFEMIKKGGTLDYEEYFNRKVIGNNLYSSGHYLTLSGMGNYGLGGTLNSGGIPYGNEFYYCFSDNGIKMGTGGCYNDGVFNTEGIDLDSQNAQQRYGQYSFQFIDYNSNYNNDDDGTGNFGDEDGDGDIKGDDDDEYVGDGPDVFGNGPLAELYLISGDKKTRTYFRWNVKNDPEGPPSGICDINSNFSENKIVGNSCLGTIEYIILDGKDWGMDHIQGTVGESTENDGVIDTWIVNENFSTIDNNVAGRNTNSRKWVSLFPETINVSEFKVFAYPNKDLYHSWKNVEDGVNISPYVILKLKLMPSWTMRKQIQGEGKEIDFSMTINLSEIYSQ